MFRIGSFVPATNLFLSPIAGYCDLAFRLTVRPLGGVGLACTDLINPRGLLRQTFKSMQLIQMDPADHPLCVQLYGAIADEMALAAEWCEDRGAATIDINMGCPVDKVCKKDGGSALLRNPINAVKLAERVVRAVKIPVTVKMRLGWDESNVVAPRLAAMLEEVGVQAVTIHGRTAAQKFGGTVRLEGIGEVVAAVKRIPVIGNGDIKRPQDALRMMQVTGCQGVMIGRAALSDPWIFRDTHAFLTTGQVPPPPTPQERVALMTRHFEHLLRIKGERLACIVMRQRVSWYAKFLPWSRDLREGMRMMTRQEEYWEQVSRYLESGMYGPQDSDCQPARASTRDDIAEQVDPEGAEQAA